MAAGLVADPSRGGNRGRDDPNRASPGARRGLATDGPDPDALGLAVFSVLGCLTALNAGTPAGVSVIIGTVSGITGGISRDLLTGQPAAVFTGRFYALAAIAGTALYALLIRTSFNASLAWWISVAGVFALGAYALRRDWTVATIVPTKQHDAHHALLRSDQKG